jgi:oxalate decarboxylase
MSATPTCSTLRCSGVPDYAEESLSYWLTHTPPALVAQHLNIDEATIAKFVSDDPVALPA